MRVFTAMLVGLLAVSLVACRRKGAEGNECRYRTPGMRERVASHMIAGTSATAGYSCDEGLFCDSANGGHVCRRPQPAGALCSEDGQCVEGLFCDPAVSPRRCSAQHTVAGVACRSAEHCAHPLFCIEQRCAPARSEGQPCAEGIACADGLACIDARCSRWRALGEPCDGVARCQEGLLCLQNHCVAGQP
jgi:hypothetical protein